jgi:hypothetical protein
MADKQPYDYRHMKTTLDSLMLAWAKQPYLRLGQLLMNAGKVSLPTHGGPPDLFSIQDDDLARIVIKYVEESCGPTTPAK